MDAPDPDILNNVATRLPAHLARQRQLEAHILENGRPLTQKQTALAQAAGVAAPDKVRLLEVPHIPRRNTVAQPTHDTPPKKPVFRRSETGGAQAGYGLVINQAYLQEDWLMAHELAHVRQFEMLGPELMLRRLLVEHQVLQGKLIPLSRKAITGFKSPDYFHQGQVPSNETKQSGARDCPRPGKDTLLRA